MQRVAVYIDGFNLYFGMKKKFGKKFFWLDPYTLGSSFLTGGQELVRVVYFTARVRNDPPAQANQGTYLSALRALALCEVIEGRFQSKQQTWVESPARRAADQEGISLTRAAAGIQKPISSR